jgi:hypothetical protein
VTGGDDFGVGPGGVALESNPAFERGGTFNGDDATANPLDVAGNWNGLCRCYLPTSVDSILAFAPDLTTNRPVMPLTP